MGMLTWKQAAADYEKKNAGSNTASTTTTTSGTLSWKQAADEYDRYDEDGYKALGQQRIHDREREKVQRTERASVSDWMERYDSVMQGVSAYDRQRNGGFTRDASGGYSSRIESLIADYEGIKGFADQYGFRDSQKYVDKLKQLRDSIGEINSSFAQFEDEDSYNQYMAYWQDIEEKRNLDLEAYSREITSLEQQLEDYDPQIDWTDTNQRKQYDAGLKELEDEINRRKQYLAQAQRIQKKDDFSAVSNPESDKYDAAYASRSGYVSTELDSGLERAVSQYSMGYRDLTYEYINNQGGIRDEIRQKGRAYSKGETSFEEKGYDYMTEDEVGLYNYYYSMGGKDSAEAYLDTIQEDLNQRKAAGMYQQIEGKTGAEMLFGVEAGLDQFKSGIKGAVRAISGDDAYVAPSATQYASGMVREDLADDGWKLPSWLGGASLGQVGYDAITTTANMAPSIAVGMLNPTLGTAALGVSAGGSAYQEALNEGYSVDQARGYGILSGASEVVMEKLLGGISAYGGNALGKYFTQNMKNADTALKRIAKEIGGSMLSEFSEEYLQEVLTPVFRNLTLGTDEEVKLVSAEALYAGFLGAITGGVLEGPSAIVGSRNASTDNGNAPIKESLTTELANSVKEATVENVETVTEEKTATPEESTVVGAENATTTEPVTLEVLSQKYGQQAKAMEANYIEGQDLEEYDRAFQMAYDMGKAGVSTDYVRTSEATSYLSESQREIAYEIGAAAAANAAKSQVGKNAAAANGKTGWRKGTVKGLDVKIADMSKAFNDPQRKAYKYLSNIAEVTGVDIVLYKSEVGQDGKYQGAQGSFKRNEDTIYIDVNAGLTRRQKLNSPEDLAKYTMMRTYTHEFTHFVEKWNPEEYNGFRKTVFEVMETNGENVDDLIVAVQNARGGNMSYDQASREVVAEAMTDILPDSHFIEQLAQKNQNVFQQLLSKLKEFLTSLKTHFAAMGDASREAKALKKQMGETVSYMEEIVKKFDEVAVKAVENYQRTVAEDATVSKEEKVVSKKKNTTETKPAETVTEETVSETEETVSRTEDSVIESSKVVSEVEKVASEDASPIPETEQHQARKTGNEPSTAREWSAFNRSFANKTNGMTAGQEKKIVIWTADHAYFVNATGYMEGDITQKVRIDGNEYKLDKLIKEFENGTDGSGKAADTWAEVVQRRTGRRSGDHAAAEHRADAGRNDAVDDGKPGGNGQRPYWESDGYSSYEELIEAVESGALIPDENGDPVELYQERTEVLTDRDALDYAAQTGNELGLTGGEQLALKAFRERLSGLQRLQEQRSDLGKEWRSLAFGEDRKPAEARKTLDKMRELDKEIKGATEKLLSLEDAPGLRAVIEKSKAAIERREKAKIQDELKQYRNKQNNAVLRKKIRKTVKALDTLLKSETKEKHVPDKMKKAVADALSLMNELDLGVTEKRLEAAKAGVREIEQKLAQAKESADSSLIEDLQAQLDEKQLILDRYERSGGRLTALKDAYEDIKNSTDPDIAAGYDADVAGNLKELAETIQDTAFQDMSREQLQDVLDMYTMVLTRVRDANKQLGARRGETLKENAAETEADIRKFGRINNEDRGLIGNAVTKWVRSFTWNNLRPVDAFHRLGSRKLEQLYMDVVDGMAQRGRQIKEIGQFITDIRKKTGYKGFDLKEAETYTTVDGKKMKLTLAEKMSIYAYSKRPQAFDHMTEGGFTYARNLTYKEDGKIKVHTEKAETWRLSLEDLQAICTSLTAQQRQYVDGVQQFLTEFGRYGDKVNMELYGIKLFNKENAYFPLKSDRDYRKSVETRLGSTMTAASLKNDGMTKKTVPGANNPIVLEDFDRVVFTHLDKMVNYANLVLPLENLRRVFDYQTAASEDTAPMSMKALIQGTFGTEAEAYINQFLTDANGTRMGMSINPLETMFARSKGMAVSANLSVMIQQVSAVVRAAAEIAPQHLLWAAENRKGTKLYDELVEYAPIAVIKDMGGFDTGSNRSIEEYIGFEEAPNSARKAWNSAQKLFGKGAETMDKVGWCIIWNGVKREVASRKQYQVNSEDFLQECGRRFTEVIVKTQVYDSVLSRSGYMRDKHGTMRYLTSFMGEPTVQAGMVFSSHLDVVRAVQQKKDVGYHVKRLLRTDAALIGALMVNGMLKAIPYAMRDDDEDEGYWERWAKHFGSAVSELWKPWELLPILRNIDDIWQGYSITQPDMALLEGLLQAGKRVYDVMQDEEKLGEMTAEDYYGLAKDLLGSVGNFAGVPVENIWRDAEGVVRVFKDMTDGIDSDGKLLDALQRGVKGEEKTKYEGIYDAMVSGDTARLDALRATYKTDNSYQSAVRKALRLHDPRIREMANARYEDDYDRLEALSYEIESEGIFDMATIRAAYEAERTAQAKERGITLEEDSAAEQKDESTVFSMEEYYAAIRSGSRNSIQTAYDALIEEKKQEYYLQSEAESSVQSSVTSKVKGEYLDEDISKADAKAILTKYGGKSNAEAETEIKKWEFQMEYHYAWGSRDRCYRSETITRSQLVSAVMDIEDASREEAQEYVDFLELEMSNEHVDITASEASGYFEHAKPHGISVEVYLDYKARTKGIQNDKDVNGDSIPHTAVQKIMTEIGKLPLTDSQKYALARSQGWAEKTIQKYKTW